MCASAQFGAAVPGYVRGMPPCDSCDAGPTGHDGHGALVTAEGDAVRHAIFRCTRCGSRWRRFWFERNRFCWVRQVPEPSTDPA